MPNNRQPEAEPSVLSGRARFSLLEALEQVGQELGGDAPSRVDDRDASPTVGGLQANVDAATRRRELHGVENKIPEYLLQPCRVAGDAVHEGIERRGQRQLFRLRGWTDDVDGHLDDRCQLDELRVQGQLATHDP